VVNLSSRIGAVPEELRDTPRGARSTWRVAEKLRIRARTPDPRGVEGPAARACVHPHQQVSTRTHAVSLDWADPPPARLPHRAALMLRSAARRSRTESHGRSSGRCRWDEEGRRLHLGRQYRRSSASTPLPAPPVARTRRVEVSRGGVDWPVGELRRLSARLLRRPGENAQSASPIASAPVSGCAFSNRSSSSTSGCGVSPRSAAASA
jgi:hypothetical protein